MKPSFDIKVSQEPQEWDGETFVEERDLLLTWPALAEAEEIFECDDWDCEECEAKRGLWDNIRRKKSAWETSIVQQNREIQIGQTKNLGRKRKSPRKNLKLPSPNPAQTKLTVSI